MPAPLVRALLLAPALALAACCCPSPCDPCRPCCPPPCCPRVDWSKVKDAPVEPTLYERLGGMGAIAALVDDFLPRLTSDAVVMGNPQVKERLAKADAEALRKHLIDMLCCAADGPCTYKGRSMKESHAGLKITAAEWDAGAAAFVASLDQQNVGPKEKEELLALVGATKSEIVGQ